ncbi:MAG: tyrosine-type recombinase/integrase [Thermoplasmata archaeon]|nr:tyrosine-type recombinase/integrase [Thermoplasmata archaeon]
MASAIVGRERPTSGRRHAFSAPPVEEGVPSFGGPELVDRFSRLLRAQERSPCTVKQYTHIARTFLGFVGKPLDEVTLKDLERYREYLVLERKYSKNSLYTTVRGLACLFRSFGFSVADGLEAPRRPERLPHYLSEEETHRLFDAVKDSSRDSAILHILAFCGLRVGELCHLALEDVEFERNILHVRSGKGDKDREVVLEDRTRAAIDRYLTERALSGEGNSRLIPVGPVTVERIVRRAARIAEIPRRVTPHMLRHTLATALLSRGCDIRYIQKLLGHASVATTQIYTHVDTTALKAAYQRAKPEY